MRRLGRVILIILAAVGSLTLLSAIAAISAIQTFRPEPLPGRMVLSLDLDAGVVETEADSPLAKLRLSNAYPLRDVLEGLDRASRDPRIQGLVARLDSPSLGMGRAQELRDAILAFQKSGKSAVVFSSSLGETSSLPYYLASAFREIWLQPSGTVGLTGFMAEQPFLKGTLDLLDIKPEFGARYEYKTAIDMFTGNKFTQEGRESLQLLIDSWTRQAVNGIAEARKLKPEQVKGLVDRAPLLAEEARQAGLVDRLGYWSDVEKLTTEGGGKLIDLADYVDRVSPEANAVQVALIYGVGTVQDGDGDDGPLGERGVMSARRITKAFRDAAKDPSIKAILFRIDSPGGSYAASDAIWKAVGDARAGGKPVVVSMGNVAASGGYFAAMAADKIVAQPGTITGSIGVFSGKMVLADFWKKLGVSWDEVHSGRNAPMWSANQPFSPSAWERVNALLDHVYADFTGKAAQDRGIKPESMDRIARGRIWPGEEAKGIGLIDQTGGYATATGLLRQLAHLPSQMPVQLIQFPRQKEPLEYLLDLARQGRVPPEMANTLTGLGRIVAVLGPVLNLLDRSPAELRMPEFEVR